MSNRAKVLSTHTAPRQVRDTMTPHKHKGYGKVILFGEHFVVYDIPAVVCAVNEYTDCMIERIPGTSGWTVVDNRPAVPGYKTSKAKEQALAHDLVIDHLGLDLSNGKGIRIHLGGDLVPTSGIGASASNVTSLARAFSDCFDLNLTEDEVNAAAYRGEAGYHGTPSGIDNTAATFGGLLSFCRSPKGPKFTLLKAKREAYLVVVSTGMTASTTEVVGEVRERRSANLPWFEGVAKQYQALYDEGVRAVEAGQWAVVGALMNKNHELCRDELNLSIPELESIVQTARTAGALGAKLSGTGRGGIAIALCDTTDLQAKVANALKKLPASKFVWQYTIGGE